MRSFLKLWLLCAAADGQDRHDWQSLAQLQPGDRVRLSLKTGPVTDTFQSWTPQELTVGTVTAKREDVIKIERYHHGGSRGKHAAIGASFNLCGGFICITRPEAGAVAGGAGAAVGGVIGALLPARSEEVIYSSR